MTPNVEMNTNLMEQMNMLKNELKKEREKFIEGGGEIVDFQYSNPLKSTYNSYLYDYKVKRNEYFANQDNQLKSNLEAKLGVIEELKQLRKQQTKSLPNIRYVNKNFIPTISFSVLSFHKI